MNRPRRQSTPAVVELETRRLLAAQVPTVVWLGQDGHDLVGPSSTPAPDGVQDIHIALSNLSSDETITRIVIYGNGGGAWEYAQHPGNWAAALVRAPGATTADVYVEPYQVETGRSFQMDVTYGDGTVQTLYFQGGTADPALRMPSATVQVAWVGQDGQDLTGPGPNVGPDGFQDVHVTLAQLSSHAAVQSIAVTSSAGVTWRYGYNPQLDNNAEFVVNPTDSTQGDLYFSPLVNLSGQTLTVSVVYTDGTFDQTTLPAGLTDPGAAMPAPAPVSLVWNDFSATWSGQDGRNTSTSGYVHVALAGLPASSTIVSARLSDAANTAWFYSAQGIPDLLNGGGALGLVRAANSTSADIFFAPVRNEAGSTLTITVTLSDGSTHVTQFAGGTSDPDLLSPAPATTSVTAHPGDDLNALANQYGTVHLAAGTYTLSQPFVLNQPVTITADPGTTLLFSQDASAPTWTAAIKLGAGNITLDGFAVRFAGPIRWNNAVNYGPAVIGTRDNLDPPSFVPAPGITITNLDIQSPPPASSWEVAPSLMRLVNAQSGTISGNTLQGGTIEFFGGPWNITNNNVLGTVAGTFSYSVISGHYTHDVTISGNHVQPVAGAGKTWRFVVLTQRGVNDVVQGNTVIGVGPMDSDTVPNPNAPEVILTESYRLHFEGIPTSVSPDGWVVQIPSSQNGPAQTGDVLAILSGPQAGQWRKIAQAIGPNTFLLDAPITPGQFAVSVTVGGFVNETFKGNTVDSTGSSTASNLVLAGNQFGAKVLNNTFIGGRQAFALTAYPTESPNIWGWSHVPFLGGVINGNTIQDALDGGVIDVNMGGPIKSSAGRVYFSATLNNNTAIYTQAFLDKLSAAGVSVPPAITVGNRSGLDPAELVLSAQGNQVELPPGVTAWATLQVNAATINGAVVSNQGTVLPVSIPPVPANVKLVVDNGVRSTDGVTSDTRLQILTDPAAAGYEYSLTGVEGSYLPVATPSVFQPAGLTTGFNVVYVRAYNTAGARGPVGAIAFINDPSSASSSPPPGSSSLSNRRSSYEYRIGTTGPWQPLGVEAIPDPSVFGSEPPVVQLRTVGVGAGGNIKSSQPSPSVKEVSAPSAAPARPPAAQSPSVPAAPGPQSPVPVRVTAAVVRGPLTRWPAVVNSAPKSMVAARVLRQLSLRQSLREAREHAGSLRPAVVRFLRRAGRV